MSADNKKRIVALDVFRGMTIMGMILVNNPGSWSYVYSPLKHAAWHGWTPTDFIFPFFLFIVGVAMALSLSGKIERGEVDRQLWMRIARRVLMLFGLGILLSLYPKFDLATVRIPGVLQRIAVCYGITAILMIKTGRRAQIWTAAGLVAFYWLLLKLVPVPGYGAGDLSPAGNLGTLIDSTLLKGHTWGGAPAPGFDPEGILSTLGALATTLLGVFTGYWLRSDRPAMEKTASLFAWGTGGLVAGNIMHLMIPINKGLWTPSYVVFMAGMALIFLAMSMWLIDIKGYNQWVKPFIIFGSNAILVFTLSSVTARILIFNKIGDVSIKTWLYEHVYASWAGPVNGSLAYAVVYILIWLGIATFFYRKKLFIKI